MASFALKRLVAASLVGLALVLTACGQPATQPTPTRAAPAAPTATPRTGGQEPTVAPTATPAVSSAAPATPTSVPARSSVASSSAIGGPSSAAAGGLLLTLVPDGSEARYRVREQLAERPLPSDAVGTTKAVSGTVRLEPNGAVVRDQSKIVVDLRSLRSDEGRRDNFIQRNTLETSRFPTAEFVPTETRGLPFPLPTSAETTFELVGDLSLHGVTRPMTWQVTAQPAERDIRGRATTSFKFGDFGLTPPRVFLVLSVDETIRLEFDFLMTR